jgi:hypothetical protein
MGWYDFLPGGHVLHEAWRAASGQTTVTPETHGVAPTNAAGNTNYEYAHATVNRDEHGEATGFSTGLGLTRGRLPWSGEPGAPDSATADVLNANLDLGHYRDSDGNNAYGLNANANTLRMTGTENFGPANGPGGFLGWEFGGPEAGVNASASTSTAQVGGYAGYLSGAGTIGTRGTETDESVRLGGYWGVGGAGRIHYGDSDRDGNREYGFGFDAGPILFDYKTEDPLHSAANIASFGLLGAGEGIVNALGGGGGPRSNWTNATGGALSRLYHGLVD